MSIVLRNGELRAWASEHMRSADSYERSSAEKILRYDLSWAQFIEFEDGTRALHGIALDRVATGCTLEYEFRYGRFVRMSHMDECIHTAAVVYQLVCDCNNVDECYNTAHPRSFQHAHRSIKHYTYHVLSYSETKRHDGSYLSETRYVMRLFAKFNTYHAFAFTCGAIGFRTRIERIFCEGKLVRCIEWREGYNTRGINQFTIYRDYEFLDTKILVSVHRDGKFSPGPVDTYEYHRETRALTGVQRKCVDGCASLTSNGKLTYRRYGSSKPGATINCPIQ